MLQILLYISLKITIIEILRLNMCNIFIFSKLQFTSFGSLIFLRFKKKKQMRNNIDQEIYELPQSTQITNGNFEDSYRISYKSLLNS